jgi:hypothetical protein
MKTAPTTTTMARMNETHLCAISTPPFDPPPRDGKCKGNEGKGGCHHCWRRLWDRANSSHVAMVVDGGGGDGIFATAVNNDNAMVVVAKMSLVGCSGGGGCLCRSGGGGS